MNREICSYCGSEDLEWNGPFYFCPECHHSDRVKVTFSGETSDAT